MRRLKLARSSAGVRWKDVLFSLHLKATMMKISDPIMFGHCVKAPWLSGESSCQHGPGRSSSVSNVSSQLHHAVSPFTITIYSKYAALASITFFAWCAARLTSRMSSASMLRLSRSWVLTQLG